MVNALCRFVEIAAEQSVAGLDRLRPLSIATPAADLAPHPGRQHPGARLDLGERDVLVGAVGDPDVARPEDHARRCRRR